MGLVMIIEAFTFLLSIGIKQRGVKIKQHEIRPLNRINDLYALPNRSGRAASGYLHPSGSKTWIMLAGMPGSSCSGWM